MSVEVIDTIWWVWYLLLFAVIVLMVLTVRLMLRKNCDNCKQGRVKQDRIEYIANVEINVYKCDFCGKEYI